MFFIRKKSVIGFLSTNLYYATYPALDFVDAL